MTTRQDAFGDSEEKGVMRVLPRLTLVIVTTLILVNLVAALGAAGYQIYYDGRMYPGVSVWGADLSGLTPEEAVDVLEGQFNYPQNTIITFRDDQRTWTVSAAELGVEFDIYRTVQAAYEVGRHPDMMVSVRQQATAWREGYVMSPVIVYDQQFADATLRDIAGLIDQPVVDAEVQVNGLEAVATPSQVGRQVDVNATLTNLERVLLELQNAEVAIVINEVEPQVTSALDTAQTLNRILSQDLEVYIADPLAGDPGPWYASREALADMIVLDLAFDADGQLAYTISLSPDQLRSFLTPLAPELAVEPEDARFVFDEASGELDAIQPSVTGRELDVAGTIQVINSMVLEGDTQIPLAFNTVEPSIPDTATAEELGVTELVSSATTYFAGSSEARRVNIEVAASHFNGVVIGPGETFSFNEYLGDVSTEEGFEEAFIIYNGRTIPGVGGGVCQVSTTAFQAAFYAGFPILERVPHAYSVGYYEVGEGIGMDATVYSPIVDMKFQNDTGSHLLIETSVDKAQAQVTFRFYSTSDGRTVQKDGPYIDNIVPHGPPIYEEVPTLPPGTIKQVDYAQDGKDVTIYRIVYRDGEILYQDTFFTQYIPWQAIYQVAPGEAP